MSETDPLAQHAVCENCKSAVSTETYCPSCGFPANGSEKEKKIFKDKIMSNRIWLGDAGKKIREAKIVIYVLAGITLVFGLIQGLSQDDTASLVVNVIICLLYLICAAWANNNPFAAILTSFIIYLTVQMPASIYYFLTLFILGLYKLTSVMDNSFESLLTISIVDVFLVIVFWINYRRQLAPLFSFRDVKPQIIVFVITGCVLGAACVYYLADIINTALNDDVFYDFLIFADTSHPELFAILFVCVQPAIFEEVAFRGFLFSNIQAVATPQSAIYITSIMFGILHLAFIGLLWLIPIGLAFAFLRNKYNTLWYGMIGHFTYNFTIMFIEYINLYGAF